MALTVGTNSWVTQTEANDYISNRINAIEWTALSSGEKDTYLISAYRWIQQQSKYSIPASATATKVKWAQIETAIYMLKSWAEHEKRAALQAQGVDDFKLLSWEETYNGKIGLPWIVQDMLEDYLTGLGGGFITLERDYDEVE
jgi:hypothetical protein